MAIARLGKGFALYPSWKFALEGQQVNEKLRQLQVQWVHKLQCVRNLSIIVLKIIAQ